MSGGTRARVRLALIALTGGALALRSWGLEFGLPLWSNYYVRPDESVIVETALRVGQDPRFYFYPALMSWLCGAVFAIHHGILGWWDPALPASLEAHAGVSFDPFFRLARGVSAVAGAAMLWPGYAAAARFGSPRAGLIAAALIALSPLAVREAHFAVTDTLMTLLGATLLACVAWLPSAPRRAASLGILGALLGLTVSAKYTGVFFVPAVIAGVLLSGVRSRSVRELGIVSGVAAGVFLVTNPYLVLHVPELLGIGRLLAGAVYEREGAAGAWSILGGARTLWGPLVHGPGLWLGPGLAALGIAACLRTPARRDAGLIGVAALAGIGLPLFFAHVAPSRYVLPLVPVVAVYAGVALGWPTPARLRPLQLGVVVAICVLSAVQAIRLDAVLAMTDTRSLAGRWLAANLRPGCAVAFRGEPETEPQLRETAASIQRRIDTALARYGPVSGEVVSRPYRLALRASGTLPDRGHFEVYRNAPPPADTACVAFVTAGYPGFPSPRRSPTELAGGARGAPRATVSFSPFANGWSEAPIEPFDAFFVPLGFLDRVVRPGPVIEIALYAP